MGEADWLRKLEQRLGQPLRLAPRGRSPITARDTAQLTAK
tara:strand:+ start:244 stop:363 length:120 start_codon:yes stop_codon:yes gene_type:complete